MLVTCAIDATMWIVPGDVVVMPCDELARNLGIEVAHERGDHAIVKIDDRDREAVVMTRDVAELVGRFRVPQTIETAAGGDAELIATLHELVDALATDGLIVDADRDEQRVLALAGAGEQLLQATLARFAGDDAFAGAEPAGIALALGRIAALRDDRALAELARRWLARAVAEDGPRAVGVPDVDFVRAALAEDTHAVLAFVRRAVRDDPATLVACCSMLAIAPPAARPAVLARADAIARALVDEIAGRGPIGEVMPRSLGVAHGWAGIIHAILAWCAATGATVPAAVAPRLDELAALAEPVGRGTRWEWRAGGPAQPTLFRCTPGWCNGSAGFVHLWLLAHALLGRADHHALAETSAWNAWDERWTNGSVCCGLAGQAYALVRFAAHTGAPEWHARGRALAELAAQRMTAACLGTSQFHQLDGVTAGSLYRGDVGVALLAAELAHAPAPRMPLFA